MKRNRQRIDQEPPSTIRIKPGTYQPTKAEKEEVYRIEGDPKEALKCMFRRMDIVRDLDTRQKTVISTAQTRTLC